MKVLFITYHYLNGNGGGVFASRAYINAFAELSQEMTLLHPMKEGAIPEHINEKVNAIPVWYQKSRFQKGLDLLFGRTNRFMDAKKLLKDELFDVVVFDTSMVVHGLIDYFKAAGAKIITIHHNYQYEYFRDNSTFPLRYPTLYWGKKYEREAVVKSDLNLTLTTEDGNSLRTHYGTGKEWIETIGTFEYERNSAPALNEVEEDNFLITGTLSAKQSEDSLLGWIDGYYPVLKEVFPKARLTLAGRDPSDALLNKAAGYGINVIPSPDDMNPILAGAKYYICPVSLGGGIKLRVMDGLRFGLPVICHSVSARGYEEFERKGMLLSYSNKDSFKTRLNSLKNSEFMRNEICRMYKAVFSFDCGKERVQKALNSL